MINFAETVLNTKPNKPEENIIPYTYEETVLCIYEYGECYRNLNKELSLFSEAEGGDKKGAIRKALDWLKKMIVQFWNWLKRVFGFASARKGKLSEDAVSDCVYELDMAIEKADIPVATQAIKDIPYDTMTDDDVSTAELCLSKCNFILNFISNNKMVKDSTKNMASLEDVYSAYTVVMGNVHALYKLLHERSIYADFLNSSMLTNTPSDLSVIVNTIVSKDILFHSLISSIITYINDGGDENKEHVDSIIKWLNEYIVGFNHSYESGRLVVVENGKKEKRTVYTLNTSDVFTDIMVNGGADKISGVLIKYNVDIKPLLDKVNSMGVGETMAFVFVTDVINHIARVLEQVHKDETAGVYIKFMIYAKRCVMSLSSSLKNMSEFTDKLDRIFEASRKRRNAKRNGTTSDTTQTQPTNLSDVENVETAAKAEAKEITENLINIARANKK